MERAEWLRQMRKMTEAIYDHQSPEYWTNFGLYPNETQLEFLRKFLNHLPPHSNILSAACGAGRYDGILLDAGHSVVGIDQSAGMLARAREHFPEIRYEKMGLQEMNFHEAFEGMICMDAMEHICPEDWPGIINNFSAALKPGGLLYFTVEVPDAEEVNASYEKSKAMGLPVIPGEVADQVEASYRQIMAVSSRDVSGSMADLSVYHYYPSLEQVRSWLDEAGLTLKEEGTGLWYEHLIARKG
jgi:SAM-dependent methyltransferase